MLVTHQIGMLALQELIGNKRLAAKLYGDMHFAY